MLYPLSSSLAILVLQLLGFPAAAANSIAVPLHDPAGEKIGEAKVTQLAKGVRVELEVRKLSPGPHALHFHENGSCKAPDFKSAGNHYEPKRHEHGFDSKRGPHAGDMANIVANSEGVAQVDVINPNVTLRTGQNSLLKPGGTALVIHEKADDYRSQPAGEAGGRVACGEIKKTG